MRYFLACALLFSLLFAPHVAAAQSPFKTPEIVLDQVEGGVKVSLTLTPSGQGDYSTLKVPFSAEPYTLVVTPASRVVEYNLFNSGLAMDLDGDGQMSGTIALGCFAGGVVQLANTPVRPWGQSPSASAWRGVYRESDGSDRLARVSKKGAWFALYSPCGPNQSTTMAISPSDKPIVIHERVGPLLQFMVLEEVFLPSAEPKMSIEKMTLNGRKVKGAFATMTHSYEPIFGQQAVWHAAIWRMIPLGKTLQAHRVEAQLALKPSSGRRIVVAIINQSPAPGVRERIGSASAVIGP